MEKIEDFLDKQNLHHAYLLEGRREELVPALQEFFKKAGLVIAGSPDFIYVHFDTLKVDDALWLKDRGAEKSWEEGKKILMISANNFLLEAQNTLLKMFEEPIPNTHFFLIMPDVNLLLKTVVSRFFVIKNPHRKTFESASAEHFLKMSRRERIEFLKNFLADNEDAEEVGGENIAPDSVRSKALSFLNSLEYVLHDRYFTNTDGGLKSYYKLPLNIFESFLLIRRMLRIPGSSVKNMMESLALNIPSF